MPELDEKTIQELKSNIENASTSFSPQCCETWDERADEYAELRDTCIARFLEYYARGLKDPTDIKDYVGLVKSDGTKARGASSDAFKELELFGPLELTKPPIFKKLEKAVIIEGTGCTIHCSPELQNEDLYYEPKMPIIHKEDDDVCYIQPSLFGTITRNMRTYDFNTMVDMLHEIELLQTTQSHHPIQFELSFQCVPVDADSIFGLHYDGLKRSEWNWFIKDLYKLTMQFILENHSLHILDLLEPISINYHMEGHRNAAEVSKNQHEDEKRLRTKSLRSNGRI